MDDTTIHYALLGERGPDQQRIAEVGLEWITLLLKKNADYGSSVWKQPILAPDCSPSAAIRVRMSDKISRLNALLSKAGTPEVDTESIDDTMRDLGAYCLLELARPKETNLPQAQASNPIAKSQPIAATSFRRSIVNNEDDF